MLKYSNEFYQAILSQLFKKLDSKVVIDAVVAAMRQVPIERRYRDVKQAKRVYPEVDQLLKRLDQLGKKWLAIVDSAEAIINEGRILQSYQQLADVDWERLLLSNASISNDWQKRLRWYRTVDDEFVNALNHHYLADHYGYLVEQIEQRVFAKLRQQLATHNKDGLFADLFMRPDGFQPVVRYHQNGRTSYFDLPLIKDGFIKLESGLAYGVQWQITLPGRLNKWVDNDYLRIPLVWDRRQDAQLPIQQVQNWHSRVVVHVLYGYDLTGDYYFDPFDQGKFKNALQAQLHYNRWRKDQPYWKQLIQYPSLALPDWKKRYANCRVDLSKAPHYKDPKAIDVLGQSRGYNQDFQELVDPVTQQVMVDFNYLWHEVLAFPAFIFGRPNIKLHI